MEDGRFCPAPCWATMPRCGANRAQRLCAVRRKRRTLAGLWQPDFSARVPQSGRRESHCGDSTEVPHLPTARIRAAPSGAAHFFIKKTAPIFRRRDLVIVQSVARTRQMAFHGYGRYRFPEVFRAFRAKHPSQTGGPNLGRTSILLDGTSDPLLNKKSFAALAKVFVMNLIYDELKLPSAFAAFRNGSHLACHVAKQSLCFVVH